MSENKSDKTSKEQSAIDIIYLLKDSIERIDKKIDVLDSNIKLLNNKIVKVQKTVNNLTLSEVKDPDEKVSIGNEADIVKTGKRSDKYVTGPVRTFGKILAKNMRPIPDVQVAIFNDENEAIKTRKTDSHGYWEVRLPSGKFSVQYTHKNFKPINLNIILEDGITDFEVK
jgi:hypothetical protein